MAAAEEGQENIGGARGRGIADLLNREIPDGLRREWTQALARGVEADRDDRRSVFVFRIGLEWMALPAGRILRVATGAAPHSIPRRHAMLLGIISVQGELVTCISLSHLLGIDPAGSQGAASGQLTVHQDASLQSARNEKAQWLYILAAGDGGTVAFPVDEVHGMLSYCEPELKEAPATVAENATVFTRAVLPWNQQAVGCLDDAVLFYAIDRNLS